ncbi:Glucosidase 2 subunit beta, partial [Trema orientale]
NEAKNRGVLGCVLRFKCSFHRQISLFDPNNSESLLKMRNTTKPNSAITSSIALIAPMDLSSISDCCDGNDEYDGNVKCPNTCWEAEKVARDKLTRKIATFQEDVAVRKQEFELAKEAIARMRQNYQSCKRKRKCLID